MSLHPHARIYDDRLKALALSGAFVLDVRSLFYRKSYPLFFLIFPADFAKLSSDGSFSPRRWLLPSWTKITPRAVFLWHGSRGEGGRWFSERGQGWQLSTKRCPNSDVGRTAGGYVAQIALTLKISEMVQSRGVHHCPLSASHTKSNKPNVSCHGSGNKMRTMSHPSEKPNQMPVSEYPVFERSVGSSAFCPFACEIRRFARPSCDGYLGRIWTT